MRFILAILLLSAACAGAPAPAEPSAAEPFLSIPAQLSGHWTASGTEPSPPDGGTPLGWTLELHLEGTRYVRTGYPAWDEHGTVTRVERSGSTYRLHLTEHVRNDVALPDGIVTLTLSDDGTLGLDNFRLLPTEP